MQSTPFKLPVIGEEVGAYRVVDKVGQGGQGHVFKAECQGRGFVLKFFQSRPDAPRGERELDILRRLEHPHVVRVLGYGRWPDPERGFLYLVMEWVEGLTLEAHARAYGLTGRETARLWGQVARALQEVHGRGVLHLDLKPDNVLVRKEGGEPVVVDFGVGRLEGLTTVEGRGQLAGTPEFHSPEAYHFLWEHFGAGVRYRAGVADDVWALGVTMYQVLTGTLPFGSRASNVQMVRDIRFHTPKEPCALNPCVPMPLSRVCMRLLEKDPRERCADMGTVAAALEEVLTGAGQDARWDVPLREPEPRSEEPFEGRHQAVLPATVRETHREEPAPRAAGIQPREPTRRRALSRLLPTVLGVWPVRATALGGLRRVALLGAALGVLALVGLWLLGRGAPPPDGLTPEGPTSEARVFREVAPRGETSDSGAAVLPYVAPPPHSEFAMALLQSQQSPRKSEKKIPSPAPRKTRDCVRTWKRVCAAGVCSMALVGCTTAPQVIQAPPTQPPREECPPGAEKTFKQFELYNRQGTVVLKGQENSLSIDTLPWEDNSEVVGRLWFDFGKMPEGSLLYGKIRLFGGRYYGLFTRAEVSSGQTYPICAQIVRLSPRSEPETCKPGVGDCIGVESRPGKSRIFTRFKIEPVPYFD